MKKVKKILIISAIIIIAIFAAIKIYRAIYCMKIKPEVISIYAGDKMIVPNLGSYQWTGGSWWGEELYVKNNKTVSAKTDYQEILKIAQGEGIRPEMQYKLSKVIVYKYEGNEVQRIKFVFRYDEKTNTIDTSGLKAGIYIIEIGAEEGNNKATYSFKVEISDDIKNNDKKEEIINS